jgi:uncharacterized membrane protein
LNALQMTNPQYRFAELENDSIRWMLARNCSITPRQLMGLYLSFCIIALCVGTGFWSQGAFLVAPFALLEMLLLAIAFLVYARHARDAERIVLHKAQLHVEIETAGNCVRVTFPREMVRVQRDGRAAGLIELSCKGQAVAVGRHVRPELREALAREMAAALRMA